MILSATPTGFETVPVSIPIMALLAVGVVIAIAAVCILRDLIALFAAVILVALVAGFGYVELERANTPSAGVRYAAIEHAVTAHAGSRSRFDLIEVDVADPNKAFDAWVEVDTPGKPTQRCQIEFAVNHAPTWECSPSNVRAES